MSNYVTREGLERLKREYEELKTTKSRELAEKLQRAISAGDLSENADYQEAKEEQAFLEGRIAELEEAIASAEIIEEQTGGASAIVKVGSTVLAERRGKGAHWKGAFMIVGTEETSPEEGKISHVSPLGAALIGKRIGDEVKIMTPQGAATWRILAGR